MVQMRQGWWRSWWGTAVVIWLFWTFLAVLVATGKLLDPRLAAHSAALVQRQVLHVFSEFYSWALLTPFIFWISRRLTFDRPHWGRRLLMHGAIGVGVALLMEIWVDFLYFYVYQLPWRRGPFDLFAGIRHFWFINELVTYFAVLAAGFARDYFIRYQQRQEETIRLRAQAADLQARLTEARLQALRMQLNPHFLFNTLHAISALVERDPRGVRHMIARLSELLRYALDESATQEVPLSQELRFLEGYLEIQQIRFQGRLAVQKEIASDVLEALVPTLILQPLVENAVKHGVGQLEGPGQITLKAWREKDYLCLSVRDNGPGFAGNGRWREGLGLRNTRARLEGLYGEAYQMVLREALEGGLEVCIRLPYHTQADLRVVAHADV
ncbi:sensor histidine kinase [Rhodothermus bifroesti]|uniref:Histidine kinase n=1 Tax=Rhodothermus marinus TaxID=29549 RepID=A0A7V2AYE2_RHOMR|nr:histidine kinase [Rhodothermus bifroesti]GBD01666.1 Sensor histidine kinase YpdA [bacterium HR18]